MTRQTGSKRSSARRAGLLAVSAAVLTFGLGGIASADQFVQILDFKADPVSPSQPEVQWSSNHQLLAGPGAIGNNNPDTPGGLLVETVYTLPTNLGGTINPSTGSTTFNDVTLSLTGLSASGDAVTQTILPGVSITSQPVGNGTFALSVDPDGTGPGLPVTLLTGSITNAVISGQTGGSTASFQSNSVTYTGGAIYQAMGSTPIAGTLSWSLSLDTPAALDSSVLAAFNANATGDFSRAVPEPAALSVLTAGALGLLARRRKA